MCWGDGEGKREGDAKLSLLGEGGDDGAVRGHQRRERRAGCKVVRFAQWCKSNELFWEEYFRV